MQLTNVGVRSAPETVQVDAGVPPTWRLSCWRSAWRTHARCSGGALHGRSMARTNEALRSTRIEAPRWLRSCGASRLDGRWLGSQRCVAVTRSRDGSDVQPARSLARGPQRSSDPDRSRSGRTSMWSLGRFAWPSVVILPRGLRLVQRSMRPRESICRARRAALRPLGST